MLLLAYLQTMHIITVINFYSASSSFKVATLLREHVRYGYIDIRMLCCFESFGVGCQWLCLRWRILSKGSLCTINVSRIVVSWSISIFFWWTELFCHWYDKLWIRWTCKKTWFVSNWLLLELDQFRSSMEDRKGR